MNIESLKPYLRHKQDCGMYYPANLQGPVPPCDCGYDQALAEFEAEDKRLKEAYNEIFENYIPADKMDEANNKLILLLEGTIEQIGRDLLSKP